jgi:REP element-mobilizing transposase RayT
MDALGFLGQRAPATSSRKTFEQTRLWYGFYVTGYVVMPEHVHLLMSEPERAKLSVALQMLKQNVARSSRSPEGGLLWQPRYYDFNVWSEDKRVEKLRYIHRNPVARGLVGGRRIGLGAVLATIFRGLKEWWKLSRNGRRGRERGRESWSG